MSIPSMIFTRYLYIKEEVEISLVTCILEKKLDAVFWAYELFYSGFQTETFQILWKTYYYFFATLNQSFEAYFMKKHKEWLEEPTDIIISIIVNNLIIRPFNLDVFILDKINSHLELDDDEAKPTFQTMLETQDYLNISAYILQIQTQGQQQQGITQGQQQELLNTIASHFVQEKAPAQVKSWLKIIKTNADISQHIIILSKVMGYYTKQENKPKGKNFYIQIEPYEIEKYKTIRTSPNRSAYQLLPIACEYSIDPYHYLSLFEIARHTEPNPMDIYHSAWLYCASFTPVWASRIQQYKGTINHRLKQVDFVSEDSQELFYDNYGYEPDEQRIEIQYRNIQPIQHQKSWTSVFNAHSSNGMLATLDEDIIAAFDRIRLFE